MIPIRGQARPLPALTGPEIEAIAQRAAEIMRDRAKINRLAAKVPRPAQPPDKGPHRPMRRILEAVADVSGVSEFFLLSSRRSRALARPRHIAMYLCCERTRFSLPEIGRFFDRDHTSVMHARRTIQAALDAGKGWAVRLHAQAVERLEMDDQMEAAE